MGPFSTFNKNFAKKPVHIWTPAKLELQENGRNFFMISAPVSQIMKIGNYNFLFFHDWLLFSTKAIFNRIRLVQLLSWLNVEIHFL